MGKCGFSGGEGSGYAAEEIVRADSQGAHRIKDEEHRTVVDGREETETCKNTKDEGAGSAERYDVVGAEDMVEDAGRRRGIRGRIAVGKSEG